MKRFYLIITGISFLIASALSAEKHVSPTGNDSHPGTLAQPWKTITFAGQNAMAGDTVFIHGGTYNQRLIVKNSGTRGNPIVFTRYQNDTVVIDGTDLNKTASEATDISTGVRQWFGTIDLYHVSWVEFRGLRLYNANKSNGIFGQDAHHISIENNIIDNCFNSGIGFFIHGVQWAYDANSEFKQIFPQDTSLWALNTNVFIRNNEITRCNNGGHSEVVSLEGVDTFEISNNQIHHNYDGDKSNYWGGGGENIDCKRSTRNGKIFGNKVHDSRRLGIYVEAWDGYCYHIEIFNNEVYNSGLMGINIASEWNGMVSDIRIYNNLIHHCLDGIILPEVNKKPNQIVKNVYIYNNTIVDNKQFGFFLKNPQAGNIQVKNNIVAQNGYFGLYASVEAWRYTFENNLTSGDSVFFNPSVYNYRLVAGSLAIDSAVGSLVAATDFDGNARPLGNGIDQGAFEYGNYTPPPLPKAPFGLIATVVSYKEVALSWHDSIDNKEGFKVFIKKDSGAYSEADVVEKTQKSCHINLLVPASTYTFRVVAYNAGGYSLSGDSATVTTLPPPLPEIPGHTAISIRAYNQIKVSWSSVSYADGYVLERKEGEGSFVEIAQLTSAHYQHFDTSVVGSTYYTYRVYAFNETGISGYSSEVSGTTPASPVTDIRGTTTIREIKICPIPAKEQIIIESNTSGDWLIFNTLGRVAGSFSLVKGHNSIDISYLSGGVYTIRSKESVVSYSLIVQ